ncbi:MAG: ABC transporter substrate-binding protein [Rhodospirillales bacterium]|nr:ABC transporter substrate-binding protein [Rhodospirillales bacterium]
MRNPFPLIDPVRRRQGPRENQLIGEFIAGQIGRRGFLRRGSALGLGWPLLAAIAGAIDPLGTLPARAATGKAGTTIRVGSPMPAGAIDPVTVGDAGGLLMLQQVGEFLVFDQPNLRLAPMLATAWKPNHDGSVWTFTLRKGVTFHSGGMMTAKDVVATIERLADPRNASNALSVFKGVLSPGNIEKIDDYTVAFHLDAPHGNFPYYLSSDNYNAIILPADYKGDFEKTWDGTGPFQIEKYTSKVGASFIANANWWGGRVLPARTEFSFFAGQQPQVLALEGGDLDVISQIVVQGAEGLLTDRRMSIIRLEAAIHRQVHMRCDIPPFNDQRVRRALALTLDRPAIIQGLFRGLADLGNDSPFAPVYPSANRDVPQRRKNIAEAKALMQAAGSRGFPVTLTTEHLLEMPDYAVLIQNAAREIGIDVRLKVEPPAAYYGSAAFGKSDWLDSPFGMTDYGHRGVPDVLLTAPLTTHGTWNAAHFRNPEYDRLVAEFVAEVALDSQRRIAARIEQLLLTETPIIFAYFYDYLTATRKGVTGVAPTANGELYLQSASAG